MTLWKTLPAHLHVVSVTLLARPGTRLAFLMLVAALASWAQGRLIESFALREQNSRSASHNGLTLHYRRTAPRRTECRPMGLFTGERCSTLKGWETQAEIVRSMPLKSLLICLAGIACLFCTVGTIADSIRLAQ